MKGWKRLLAIVLFAVASQAQEHVHPHDDSIPPQIFRADKSNQVSFKKEMAFGKEILPKGRYLVEHRVDGSAHLISFKSASKGTEIQLEARTIPGSQKVSRTEILALPDKDRFEIVRILVPGESVEHLF